MRVFIDHFEKRFGLIRPRTHYGVKIHVDFNRRETAIIQKRQLQEEVVLERDPPSNVSVTKLEGKIIGMSPIRLFLIMMIYGSRVYDFDLEIGDLLGKDYDTYYQRTPFDAKLYDKEVHVAFEKLKTFIDECEKIDPMSHSYEL